MLLLFRRRSRTSSLVVVGNVIHHCSCKSSLSKHHSNSRIRDLIQNYADSDGILVLWFKVLLKVILHILYDAYSCDMINHCIVVIYISCLYVLCFKFSKFFTYLGLKMSTHYL